jgi:predicted HicB family RNase H-like nuclease
MAQWRTLDRSTARAAGKSLNAWIADQLHETTAHTH